MPPAIAIRQILYISRAVRGVDDAQIRHILATSVRNNRRHDITGCLLYSGRHFAQTLEGRPEALEALIKAVDDDARHTEVRVLIDRLVTQRKYADWSMAYLLQLDLVDELEALLSGKPFTAEDAEVLMQRVGPESITAIG